MTLGGQPVVVSHWCSKLKTIIDPVRLIYDDVAAWIEIYEKMKKISNLWINWMGFGMGAIALVIADPAKDKYWITLIGGLVAMLGNSIALLRKPAAVSE